VINRTKKKPKKNNDMHKKGMKEKRKINMKKEKIT